MTTLSWNYHGLGNPRTVRTLRDLVNRFKPTFIFLMQVKIGRSKVERVKHQLQYEGLFVVEGINSGGGLALLWKEKDSARLISFSKIFIDVSVHVQNMPVWRLTGFYGLPKKNKKNE